ncbi:MAG: competence protein ComEC [Parcubacteria group bacterium Gr01-1014_66]|nr:MAG: competence protein ComEC [Parcubacteria group bacterium Gr01-1014_66]
MVRSRVFLYALISFLGGVAFRSFFAIPPGLVWMGALGAIVTLVLGIVRTRKNIAICGLFVLFFCIGIIRFGYADQRTFDLSGLYGREIMLEGVIADEPEETEKTQRIIMRVTRIQRNSLPSSFLLQVVAHRYPQYEMGTHLGMRGTIDEPQSNEEFDEKAYLARNSIFAVTLFPSIERVAVPPEKSVRRGLVHIKKMFEEKLEDALTEPHASLLKGLLLGERGGLPQEIRNHFRITGTSHILALSGYNITLIGRFVVTALLGAGIAFSGAFWIAGLAIILFVVVTGASASAVRAGIMGILLLIAQKEGRLYSIRNALAAAAALMVFQNPFLLRFDTGFQLSFAATLGLAYGAPFIEREIIRRYLTRKPRINNSEEELSDFLKPYPKVSAARTIFVETVAAQCAVLPLLVWHFGEISLISPLVNLLVLMVVPYAMGFGFAAGIAGFLSRTLAKIIGWLSRFFLSYLLWVSEVCARIPFALVHLPRWAVGGIALALVLVVWYGRVPKEKR